MNAKPAALMVLLGWAGVAIAQDGPAPDALERAVNELELARTALAAALDEIAGTGAAGAGPGDRRVIVREIVRGAPPRLGISIENAPGGVRVLEVLPDGPAAAAGMQAGDLITAVAGAPLGGADEPALMRALMDTVAALPAGEAVSFTVQRDGADLALSLAPGPQGPGPGRAVLNRNVEVSVDEARGGPHVIIARQGQPGTGAGFPGGDILQSLQGAGIIDALPGGLPAPGLANAAWIGEAGPWADLELAAMSPRLAAYFDARSGVLVIHAPVIDGLDLQDGDVIVSIDDRALSAVDHARRILASYAAGESMVLQLVRDGRRRQVDFVLPAAAAAPPRVMQFRLQRP